MSLEPLHYESVGPEPAARTGILLHGILGSGRNFRSFARKLAERSPGTRFILPDLRHHGESPHLPGPQTMEAVAEDVVRLTKSLGIERMALIGHSFGGKAAMVIARDHPDLCTALFVLDSNPGFQHVQMDEPKDHEVLAVLEYLTRHPGPFTDRNDGARVLMEDGLSERIARWIVLNLEGDEGQLRWRLEPDVILELLKAYFESNLWPFLESTPTFPRTFVIGGRSDRHSTGSLDRLQSSANAGTLTLHVLRNAGHWLHVDDPEGLLSILVAALSDERGLRPGPYAGQ